MVVSVYRGGDGCWRIITGPEVHDLKKCWEPLYKTWQYFFVQISYKIHTLAAGGKKTPLIFISIMYNNDPQTRFLQT